MPDKTNPNSLTPPVDSLDDVIPLMGFYKRYPHLASIRHLRYLVDNQGVNGLTEAGAIIRVGSRIYIVVSRFRAWFGSHVMAA